MTFMTNQIIRRNKKQKVYIYIQGNLIKCEYFNYLNGDGDMAETSIMAGIYIPMPI